MKVPRRCALLSALFFLVGAAAWSSPQEEAPATGEPTASAEAVAPAVPDDTAQEPGAAEAGAEPIAPAGPEPTWVQRVEALETAMETGDAAPEDADSLYDELIVELRRAGSLLGGALLRPGPDADRHHVALEDAYAARVRLQASLTPERAELVTGGSVEGARELLRELAYVVVHVTYQTRAIPAALRRVAEELIQTPLSSLWSALQVLLVVLLFRWWRRVAPSGLRSANERILALRPRRRWQIHAARSLWYLQRVRRPLEWIVLLGFFFALIDTPELREITVPLWTIALWLLTARFAILLIDAIAVRGAQASLPKEVTALRLRSLRGVAAWLVLLGLGLDLGEHYTGRGTFYSWTWLAFEFLAAPVLLWLLWSWKAEIFRRLEAEAKRTDRGRTLLRHQTGLGGFVNAALGAGLLLAIAAWQRLLRLVSSFDVGRSAIAMAFRHEVERETRDQAGDAFSPLVPELRTRLIEGQGASVEGVARRELERLEALAAAGHGGIAAVIAERGGGKSHLLARLAAELGERMAIVPCPVGGFDALSEALVEALGLRRDLPLPEAIDAKLAASEIRVLAIDDLDRLAKPVLGGQAELEKLSETVERLESNVLFVITLSSAAWRWLSCARSERLILRDVIQLAPWTESQIGEFVDLRTAEAELEPDFGELAIPGQLVEAIHETREERNRFGAYRVLWDSSEGNPAVAAQMWADALRVDPEGRSVVTLPQLRTAAELDRLGINGLLTLRALLRTEWARAEDVVASLQISRGAVVDALRFAVQQGWVQEKSERYQISWDWFRPITRKLARINLQGR